MTENAQEPIYEMSVNVLVAWQAHSLSTAGNNGSNRLLPRRQLLADKTETDAISGNIAKHHHAALVAEYFAADGSPLCPACRVGDGRRAAALIDRPDYQDLSIERIVRECALCDTHGFLVTAKNADSEAGTPARQKVTKNTLLDFSQRSDHGADRRRQVPPLFGARGRLHHAPAGDGRRDVPGLRVRDRRCILHLDERFHCDVGSRPPPVLVVRASRAVIRKETARKVEQRRQAGRQSSPVWLAADYHFPSTYSCRIPMSSMSSAPVMPAPGPATVRLALIRTGIECFGLDAVREELFPVLRSAPVRVRPPERVAISQQVLRGYKWSEDKAKRRTAPGSNK